MRVIGHHPLHHVFPKGLCLFVIDRDIGAITGWCHTGHDKTAALVISILILFHRTLSASTHTTQGRMPTEIGDIKSKRKAGLEQIISPINLVLFAINMDSRHIVLFLIMLPALGEKVRLNTRQKTLVLRGYGTDSRFKFGSEIFEGTL